MAAVIILMFLVWVLPWLLIRWISSTKVRERDRYLDYVMRLKAQR